MEEVYWTSTNWRVCRVKVRCPYISVLALSVGLRSVPGSTILATTPVRLGYIGLIRLVDYIGGWHVLFILC